MSATPEQEVMLDYWQSHLRHAEQAQAVAQERIRSIQVAIGEAFMAEQIMISFESES